jgi:hypothetical protein
MTSSNPFDRELTNLEKQQIAILMKQNPVLDFLYLQTVFLMPPELLAEMVRQAKAGELVEEYPQDPNREYVLKTGQVLPPE